ncbi:MAG: HD domain-containing phosphohydrolase, partial [Pirellulaceae bacterium]
AIFVGTLSDERTKTIDELHDAYVGVVEVLARYLKSVDPALNDRSKRVAALSEQVARQMRLADREVDDIRIAALLQDVQNIEITAKVIHRAVGDLQAHAHEPHTFQGADLVHSLGSVLTGALPLIMYETVERDETSFVSEPSERREAAFCAHILKTVSHYDDLVHGAKPISPHDAVRILRTDMVDEHHPAVLHALEQVVQGEPTTHLERALALTAVAN